MPAHRAIARRAFADARIRTIAFAYLFAGSAYASVAGYRSAYPTHAERLSFVHSFAGNDAVRLFYGTPYDLLSTGGYAAWRVGGLLSIFAGAWGLLAAVRALRAEEDAGRAELMLSGTVSRRGAYLSALAAIAAGAAILWAAAFLALTLAGLAVGGSAYLALAIVSVVPVFAGVGALTSQLAPTRRIATELASGALLVAFLLRTIADTDGSLQWLRWITPLGWVEELRAFTGARPLVLLLALAAAAALLALAAAISQRRDVGAGLLPAHERRRPNLRLLSSPIAQTLREERASLLAWLLASGFFALIVGVISTSIPSAGLSGGVQRELQKLGAVSITTPAGYIGFCFLFFVLVVSLFVCSQLASARAAEADEQLETLFALPVDRRVWLAGRLGLAVAGVTAIALFCGLCAWVGAASQGAGVSLSQMLGAGANCLPTAVLFLGVGVLIFALFPRASAGVSYGLVVLAFVWQLFGGVLEAPRWLLDLTPFQHVGLVPAQAFRAGAAAAMVGIAAAAMLVGVAIFRRRDLVGG
jgi:ABC-2 type transport system permease protein